MKLKLLVKLEYQRGCHGNVASSFFLAVALWGDILGHSFGVESLFFYIFVCMYFHKYIIADLLFSPVFRRIAQTSRQACVRYPRGYVPSDRSSHSPLGERDFGRVVGTLSYAQGEGAKAYYPYRMVDYCALLWFPRNRLAFPFSFCWCQDASFPFFMRLGKPWLSIGWGLLSFPLISPWCVPDCSP